MRNLKRLMAVAMLAIVATLGAQTAMAKDGILITDKDGILVTDKDGILVTDKDGILVTDKDGILVTDKNMVGNEWDALVNTIINGLTGVLLSD